MLLAAHQLHYLPWLRYVHKMLECDVFVVLDDVQFNKNGWQNRNKIKGPNGPQLLTVPVLHRMAQRLDEVEIDNKVPWRRKQAKSLEACYGRAPHWKTHGPSLLALYQEEWAELNAFNKAFLQWMVDQMGIATRIVYSSTLQLQSQATQRLVDLCAALGAKAYLTGEFAAQQYLDAGLFEQAGIELQYQRYAAPVYDQQFSKAGFISDLSIVDLLFNHGKESIQILRSAFPANAG